MNKKIFKKSPEELQEYFKFKRRGWANKSKKGKGSYTRKQKHHERFDFPACAEYN